LADKDPSERELEVLKALWALGEGSVREVQERMSRPGDEPHFNTVQTLLRIMEDKGLVGHRAEGRTFIYYPRYSRERASARFLAKVFDGALDELVVSLLQAGDASPEELKELEKLIARARREKQNREKGDA
jgi:predicted transcriptional regulator